MMRWILPDLLCFANPEITDEWHPTKTALSEISDFSLPAFLVYNKTTLRASAFATFSDSMLFAGSMYSKAGFAETGIYLPDVMYLDRQRRTPKSRYRMEAQRKPCAKIWDAGKYAGFKRLPIAKKIQESKGTG